MRTQRRNGRRLLLGGAALLAAAAPALASGCGGGFDSISKLEGLRVLTVVPEITAPAAPKAGGARGGSYANPGDEITFKMYYDYDYFDPAHPSIPKPALEILWLGGCYDPPGDAYYGCYAQIADELTNLDPANLAKSGLVGLGETYTTTLPKDIVSRRSKPAEGPYYGLAYVFFAVCAGTIKPVAATSGGQAGSFPLGCFNAQGEQLGADSFVPGYTQIYAFDDGRANENPVVTGLTVKANALFDLDASDQVTTLVSCSLAEDKRDASGGCSKADPGSACLTYKIDVEVPDDVAEIDPDSTGADGKPLHEVVWVDYFADQGDFDTEIKLVSDATTGIIADHSTNYAPPSVLEPTVVNLWAVVHDARGGSTVIQRYLRVE